MIVHLGNIPIVPTSARALWTGEFSGMKPGDKVVPRHQLGI
jgi:hypothetical protein